MLPCIWLSHYARKDDLMMVNLSYGRIYEERSDPIHGQPGSGAYEYGEYRPISVLCMVLNPNTDDERRLTLARETAERVRRSYLNSKPDDTMTHLQWAGTWYHDLIMVYFEFLGEDITKSVFSGWAYFPDFMARNKDAIVGIRTEKLIREFLK